ncbi:MAG: general secretion pathway protein GspK [Proteobacteria bacterium]|nr:general secretion pathway protein GspK [Pseudomonadota bacterium]
MGFNKLTNYKLAKKENGVILIVVLWIIIISLTMVTILASNVRLSVATILQQSNALQNKAQLMATINLAKMEILLEKSTLKNSSLNANKRNRFNGQPINLSYQYETNIVVRINELSGLINIARISRKNFKLLLEKKLESLEKSIDVEDLLDAWQDWTDSDNLTRLHGAESNYYQQKEPPYQPANSKLTSVEELKLIKGFADIFKDIDLNSIFSIYGPSASINPNNASREALHLIPGLTDPLVEKILSQGPFIAMSDFYALFSADEINKIKPWFSLRKSNFFAIIVYPKEFEKNALLNTNNEFFAYKELVQYKGLNTLPVSLKVYPMSKINLNPKNHTSLKDNEEDN